MPYGHIDPSPETKMYNEQTRPLFKSKYESTVRHVRRTISFMPETGCLTTAKTASITQNIPQRAQSRPFSLTAAADMGVLQHTIRQSGKRQALQ